MIWCLIAYVAVGFTILFIANFREFMKYGFGFPPIEGWCILVGAIALWPIVLIDSLYEYLKNRS